MKNVQIASLVCVEWDKESDKVFLKFEVFVHIPNSLKR